MPILPPRLFQQVTYAATKPAAPGPRRLRRLPNLRRSSTTYVLSSGKLRKFTPGFSLFPVEARFGGNAKQRRTARRAALRVALIHSDRSVPLSEISPSYRHYLESLPKRTTGFSKHTSETLVELGLAELGASEHNPRSSVLYLGKVDPTD